MIHTWWVGVDRGGGGEPHPPTPAGPAGLASPTGAGQAARPLGLAAATQQKNEGNMHHQDSQQACNTSIHRTIQDTNLQWHSTLGLVPHLKSLTASVRIYQSQMAGKCTNNITGIPKLNETARTASKSMGNPGACVLVGEGGSKGQGSTKNETRKPEKMLERGDRIPVLSGHPTGSRRTSLAGAPPWQAHLPGRRTSLAGAPPWQAHLPGRRTSLAGAPPWQAHLPGRRTPLAGAPPWQAHLPGRAGVL
eukprot:gene22418-biopygen16245